MAKLPRHIKSLSDPGALPALNEILERLGQGVANANIKEDADISISKLLVQDLGEYELTTAERSLEHTLEIRPTLVVIQPLGSATAYESSRRSPTAIYLTASTTARFRILVGA